VHRDRLAEDAHKRSAFIRPPGAKGRQRSTAARRRKGRGAELFPS
jgi:hypothetical protein